MTLTTPTIVARSQKRKMTVATCVSANGKPPSVIKWDTRLKGEATFQETRNQNGTVTVRSNYVVIPSRETHKQKLTCIVTYRNDKITDSVVLNVQCKSALLKLPSLVPLFIWTTYRYNYFFTLDSLFNKRLGLLLYSFVVMFLVPQKFSVPATRQNQSS